MIAPQSVRGFWWLPGQEDKPAHGVLEFTADEFALKLSGTLGAQHADGGSVDWTTLPIVLGTSEDRATDLTLIDCGGSIWDFPGDVISEVWYPSATLVGHNLEHEHELAFDQMRLRIAGLDSFAGIGDVSPEYTRDEAGNITRVAVNVDHHELAQAYVADATVRLLTGPFFKGDGTHAETGHDAWIFVDPDQPTGWKQLLDDFVNPLRDLMALSAPDAGSIIEVNLRLASDSGRRRLVELLIQTLDLGRPQRPRPRLFDWRALPGGFDEALKRWWEIEDKYELGLQRFFGVARAPFIYDEDRFVGCANAVEAMHARDHGAPVTAAEERDERVARALAALPQDLTVWAEPLLSASTPPVARHRVMEFIDDAGRVGLALVGQDREGFAMRAVTTRNYLLHLTPSLKSKALFPPARYWHGQALAWLIRAVLLRRLGWSDSEVAQLFERHGSYRHTVDEMARFVAQAGQS